MKGRVVQEGYGPQGEGGEKESKLVGNYGILSPRGKWSRVTSQLRGREGREEDMEEE